MRHLKKILGLLIGLVFLYLALRQVEFAKLPATLTSFQFWLVPVLLLSITIEQLLRVWRWQVILVGRPVGFWYLYAGMLLGYLANNVLPARAGEVVRCYYLGRKGQVRISAAFGSVVIERFLDGVAVLTMLGFCLIWFELPGVIRAAGWTALVFYAVVLLSLILLVYRKTWFDRLVGAVIRPFSVTLHDRLQALFDSFTGGLDLMRNPGPFAKALTLSLAAWGMSAVSTYIGFKAFGHPSIAALSVPDGVLVITFLALGAMIPGAPGMVGVYEWCCLQVVHGVFKVDTTVAGGYALFSHSFGYLYVLMVGLGIMTYENISMTQLNAAVEEAPSETEGENPVTTPGADTAPVADARPAATPPAGDRPNQPS